MLKAYRTHVAERATLGIPPEPLNAEQTADLVELLKNPPAGEEATLVDLLRNRIPAGVDQAAYVKASFLSAITTGDVTSTLVSPVEATEILGTMLGGYNIQALIACLENKDLAATAVSALSHTL